MIDRLIFCESLYLTNNQIGISEDAMSKSKLKENDIVEIKNKKYVVVKADQTEVNKYVKAGVPKKLIALAPAQAHIHTFSIYSSKKPQVKNKKLKQKDIAQYVGDMASDFEISVMPKPNNTFKVRVDYKPWAAAVVDGTSEGGAIMEALKTLCAEMPGLRDRIDRSMEMLVWEEIDLDEQ